MCASSNGNRTGRSEARRGLRRGLLALLDEHVLQPDAERVQVLAEPVSHNVGLIEFVARLLAGREQKDQRRDKCAVGGDGASFPEVEASFEGRAGGWWIKAYPFRRAMTESASSLMCALDTTHRPSPARTASYSESVTSMGVRQRSSPHSQNTRMGELMARSSENCLISSTTRSLTSR